MQDVGAASPVTQRLQSVLPRTLGDIEPEARASLSDRVVDAISDDPAALSWVQNFIRDRASKSFDATSTVNPTIALQQYYVCPQGDFCWTQPFITYAAPRCPTHHLALRAV